MLVKLLDLSLLFLHLLLVDLKAQLMHFLNGLKHLVAILVDNLNLRNCFLNKSFFLLEFRAKIMDLLVLLLSLLTEIVNILLELLNILPVSNSQLLNLLVLLNDLLLFIFDH